MSAEDVFKAVLYEIGLDRTSPSIGATDFETSQIREFMNQAGKDIARRAEWQKLYSTDTVSGSVSSHTLPSDFQEMGDRGTVWLNKTEGTYTALRPVVDPATWDMLVQKPSSQLYWHLRGGELLFSDALDADGAKFTYLSNQWVTGKTAVTQNADTFKIPERLIQKLTVCLWLREKGKPFDDQMAEFEANLRVDAAADRGVAA